jgi:hypothetical protein
MYGHEKSDPAVVAVKPANKAERSCAELVEGNQRFATTVFSDHATLATKRTLLLDLGRTFTGWIAPACGWRTYSITSSARESSVGGTSMRGCATQLSVFRYRNKVRVVAFVQRSFIISPKP